MKEQVPVNRLVNDIAGFASLPRCLSAFAAISVVLLAATVIPLNEIFAGTVTITADSGTGSLRQAIADAAPGDTINFAGGVTGTITLTTGELLINKNLTITGPGAGTLAISGNNSSRVIRTSADSGAIIISGLTICNGRVEGTLGTSTSGGDIYGGGILVNGFALVTLNNCVVSNNASIGGSSTFAFGGVGFGGGVSGKSTLNNCLVVSNTATGGTGTSGPGHGAGGGIYGQATLIDCTITRNTARGTDNSGSNPGGTGSGGGLFSSGGSTLTNCVMSYNLARGGDGDNSASAQGYGYGGGIYVLTSALSLNSCTLTANTARGGDGLTADDDGGEGSGGGIYTGQGFVSGPLTLDNCTFSSNNATGGLGKAPFGSGGAAFGGGIYSSTDYTFVMRSCTITSNTAAGALGGNNSDTGDDGAGNGGGIYNLSTLNMTNSTISHNVSTGGPGGGNGNRGGGLYHTLGTANLSGTIIAKNIGVGSVSPDARGTFATSSRFNLIGQGSTSLLGIVNGNNDNQVGTAAVPIDPQLGPLQDNGGPTQTRSLLAGSPAIDKGISNGATTDQRGFARTVDDPSVPNASGGDGTDIGAFEVTIAAGPTLTIVRAGSQATISWSPNTPGFGLQERTNLALGTWTNSPSGSTNPIIVPATLPTKFYRLFKP